MGEVKKTLDDARAFAELKADELKLKTTEGLSVALSRIVALLLVVALLIIVLGLLSVVLIMWLGQLFGSVPVAATVVCGVFVVALVVMFLLRKKLFRDTFVRLFIGIFYGEDDDASDEKKN